MKKYRSPARERRVEPGLDVEVVHRRAHVHEGSAEPRQPGQCGPGLAGGAGMHPGDDHHLRPVQLRRDVRVRGDVPEHELGGDAVRQLGDEVTPGAHHRPGVGVVIEHLRHGDPGTERVHVELEGSHHSQATTAAAGGPEQVRVLLAAGSADRAVGGDDLDGSQVVAAQAVGPHQHAHAAAEGETRDPGLGHLTPGRDEPEELGRAVDVAPGRAGLGADGAGGGVDVDGLHLREVDDQAVVTHGAAGHLVASAADADHRVVLAGDLDDLDDVSGVGAARDHRRVAIDQPVPHPPCRVVVGVAPVRSLRRAGPPAVSRRALTPPRRWRRWIRWWSWS